MNSETQLPKDESIGTILKGAREKKGLSREHAASIIRLRLHFIEALEEEDWKALPAPVFIKGFIRSYAQFLGINQSNAVALYEETTAHVEESPKPLVEVEKTGRLKIVLSVIILVIIAAALYLWFNPGNPVTDEISADSEIQEKVVSHQLNTPDGEPVEIPVAGEVDAADEALQIKAAETEQPSPLQNEDNKTDIGQQETAETFSSDHEPGITSPANTDPDQIKTIIAESPSTEEQTVSISGAVIPDQSETINIDNAGLLTLDGIINIRSYVKIYIDDQPAKEYIFRPGSRPQWRGNKGFDILVGNAAGVEFEFNGKNTGDLGPLGKVVRVRFPDDFESSFYEE
ncbi:helix-turn-helix domain-containing protein [Thermodesulfobacteriota bacterium]